MLRRHQLRSADFARRAVGEHDFVIVAARTRVALDVGGDEHASGTGGDFDGLFFLEHGLLSW